MDSDLDESVPLNPPAQHRTRKLAVLGVTLTLVVLAVLAVVLVAVLTTSQNNVQRGRVLVVMLGDGFGPASVSLLRAFLNHTGVRNRLHLDDHLIGSVQTASLDSRITDSAAGATAYSCGVRNFNNWIATTSDSKACGTLLEAAKRKGMRIGIVAKTSVSNASPAAFTAHSADRQMEQFIAGQQMKLGIDVILGGGKDIYSFPYGGLASPLQVARAQGYQVIETKSELLASTVKAPLLGLFAKRNMRYRIDLDANSTEPSLSEMASVALRLLIEADTEGKGVVLFVEGSEIDLAGHSNDAATQVRESLEYDDAFASLLPMVGSTGTLVSVADHATGGLVLGRNFPGPVYPNPYIFYVKRLASARSSIQNLANRIVIGQVFPFIDIVNSTLAVLLTTEEQNNLQQWSLKKDVDRFSDELGEVVSARDLISWSTWGHDAVDVGLYCAGLCPPTLKGSLRNDVVGQILADWIDVASEQATITAELADFNTTGHPDGWTQ